MSELSKEEVAKYALAHGKLYTDVCDEDGCGNLIEPGEIVVVLKWGKRADGNRSLGAPPMRIRCLDCERDRNPPKETVAVKNAPRGSLKLPQEQANEMSINNDVRKAVLRLLKASDAPVPKAELLTKLRRNRKVRELKPKEVRSTIRSLAKLKAIRTKSGGWTLPKPTKKKLSAKSTKKVLRKAVKK